MITTRSASILVFVSAILSVKSSIDEFIESCPKNAIVDLTGSIKNSSGFVEKDGIRFPLNSIRQRDAELLGCPCSFRTCLSFCCSSGVAYVKENYTSGILHKLIKFINGNGVERNFSDINYHPFVNDPCEIGWMASSEIIDFSVFENGSIYTPDYKKGSLSNFEQYCLIPHQTPSKYLAKVCRPWVKKDYFEICSLVVGILIMLANLMGYPIVAELKNLHGLIFRSYIATYIAIYISSLGVVYTTELRIDPFWFSLFEYTTRYFAMCCSLWLNIMSFNIWRSFRVLRQIGYNSEEKIRRKYMWYAIYAWFGPAVLFAIAAAFLNYMTYFGTDIRRKTFVLWGSVGVVTVALICNIFLHTSTALNIRLQKRDTANLFSEVNSHYEIDKQRFKLHFTLFMITGGHMVVWVIWLIWSTPLTMYFLGGTEVVQSSLIFAIFICKGDFKQALYVRFPGLRRIGAFCRNKNDTFQLNSTTL